MTRIAIIGAGLSGLTVAHRLQDIADITLFEKSRGISGRMATRRAEPYCFDHGAQFFTVRTDAFKDFIAPMMEAGLIARWDARVAEFVDGAITHIHQWNNDNPHYVGVPGMNALAKHIGRDLTVHCDTRVHRITQQHDQWLLYDEQNTLLGTFDWVISSVPAEQAATLLPSGITFYQDITSARMTGCFSLMLGIEHDLALDFDAAVVRGEDISWIAVNSSKPGRNMAEYSLLVHSTHQWANDHIDDDHRDVLAYLGQQTSDLIGHDVSLAHHKVVHGWRYAHRDQQHGETHLIDSEARIGACGDWLIQGRVEAAFTSGYALANHLLEILKHD